MSRVVRSAGRERGVTPKRPPGRIRPWLWLWAPVGLYMALIFVASAQSDVQLPDRTSDKVVHALVYAPLSMLIVRALARGLPRRIDLETALIAVGVTVAYGVSDEWHQLFVEGRSADRADVLADAVGGFIGAAVCWAWGTIARRSDV